MSRARLGFGGLAVVAAVVALVSVGASAPAAAAAGPAAPDFPTAFLYSQTVDPNADPPGANDWTCKPSTAHPRPVVLVHGTWENRYDNFAKLSPAIKAAGYCVFALNYGQSLNVVGADPAVDGTGDITVSAQQLESFVNQVLAATGAAQVDLVGHSQGGIVARQYLKFDGGADPSDPTQNKVRNLVELGATNHGTTLDGLATLAGDLGLLGYSDILLGQAAQQQVVGSAFLTDLNAGGDTVPGVNYTVIATRYDEVTTPYQSTFLTAGPGATVRDITLQNGCATNLSEHVSMAYSVRAIGYVEQGLDSSAPAPVCDVNLPAF
jgi:triacylglycerol esterase/lipase EstA (alpha/beta hydrolase family)